MAADEIERFRREIVERTGDARAGREPHRPGTAARGHEHGRQARPARRPTSAASSPSRCSPKAGTPTPSRTSSACAPSARSFCASRSSAARLRRQSYDLNEDRPLQRRIRRRPRHPVRLHRQAGGRAAAAAARDRPGQGRAAGARRAGNPLSARRRLPRRTARGAADRRVQRRLRAGAHARPGRRHRDAQLRHHRRARGPEPRAHRRRAPIDGASSTSPRTWFYTKWRDARRRTASSTCSGSSSASRSSGSTPASSARAAPIRRSSCTGAGRHGLQADHRRRSPARSSASGRSRPCSTPTTPPAPPRTSASTPRGPIAGRPDSRRCHINWVVLDSDWEAEFCRVAESHPRVRAYVKNHNLGLEVPYRYGSEMRKYLPDFIVLVDDGHGDDDLLHLIVEIKGYRREDAKEKKSTMDTYWVPGVNNLRHVRPLGVRRVHRGLPDRGRLQGQGRKRVQQDDQHLFPGDLRRCQRPPSKPTRFP